MSYLRIASLVCLVMLALAPRSPAADTNTQPSELLLTKGWHLTQDVRDLGEAIGWYKPGFATDWQPINRLVHLQLLLAPQPYFGRELRYFNEAPWWYRLEFSTADTSRQATLRFEGVDYFAKVWLNGTLLGEHEGYANPFEFEVGQLLRKDKANVLVVKVSSPWDHQYVSTDYPVLFVKRNLLKGSYEHADTFVQRDVNPIGIWRSVKLLFHDSLRSVEEPALITSVSSDQQKADVDITWPIFNDGPPTTVTYAVHIRERDTKQEVASSTRSVKLVRGENTLGASVIIPSPKLWTIWDHGMQPLYEAAIELAPARGAPTLNSSVTFGVRTIELRRSATEMRFFLNAKPVFIRGTTYWPDLYLSNMTKDRYERDLKAALHAGINAFRVHVHTENPKFYEMCDRLGILVIQDNDLNWVFPTDAAFEERAVQHFGRLVKQLRNHASVGAWIAMNEVFWGTESMKQYPSLKRREASRLGAKLTAEARTLDPTRSVIESSGVSTDYLTSGDTHDYHGSIAAKTTYFDIFASKGRDMLGGSARMVTEFGVDAPPAASSLNTVPELAKRLSDVMPRVAELHDYQYRLIKYYVEQYRIHKYAPTSGYFQFMWIDFSPQSFMGIYDYWGKPKREGLGGGLRAMEESNQPVGIFMDHEKEPLALYAVNDSATDLGRCVARWRVTTSKDVVVTEGSQVVQLGPDDHQKIRDFAFPVKEVETYNVVLDLLSSAGKTLAHNTYTNPFQLQPRPKGHPDRMDEELGMRLWWAGMKQ